ncbi:MAG: hypothetical protein LQ340_002539 [Diploschistes diacapsis]|nr:MAG: hypothetical protein LQ340_002539 [Diploschistes diacapsis]
MADAPTRVPRQLKLRSSCDACGAAKLRCDRAQPECGRCISLGFKCVYGVSRKMGKPPRERLRITEASSASCTPGEHAGSQARDRDYDRSTGAGNGFDGIVPSSGPVSSVNHVFLARSAVDGFRSNYMLSVDALDALHGNLFGSVLPDFTSLEHGDALSSDMNTGLVSSLGAPVFEAFSTPATQTDASLTQVDESGYLDGTLLPPAGDKGHDCVSEAYEILGGLSLHSLNNAPSISQSPPASASATASTVQRMPLDHILHLNREASERLVRLLSCRCAKSPHLTLLYASIISRILMWYQQAAVCAQSAAAKMAIGTFDVDDLHVETALKMQLLSGEMRRAGRLIDQFTSHSSGGQSPLDEYAFSGVNNLYQSLDSWLRSEHSRIANMVRSRLRELDT